MVNQHLPLQQRPTADIDSQKESGEQMDLSPLKRGTNLESCSPMLTDPDCKNSTCPPDKKRLSVTGAAGLYLEVSPGGSERWFLKLYKEGKETRLALGSYPAVSLKAARNKRDTAKLQKS